MRYSNPSIPRLDPPPRETREFFKLLVIVGAIVIGSIVALSVLAGHLAPLIPFSAEREIARVIPLPSGLNLDASTSNQAIETELQSLADRLTPAMNLPDGMTITVHYADEPVVNAFATLGGHLFVYRGLLEKLTSEDELAAVMGHEIAHVRHRHVITGMSRGIMIVLALNALGIKSSGLTQYVMNEGGNIANLAYSRDAEQEADLGALDAVHHLYGHTQGVIDLFALLGSLSHAKIEMLASHPLTERRIAELERQAAERHYATQGTLTPTPTVLAALASGKTL